MENLTVNSKSTRTQTLVFVSLSFLYSVTMFSHYLVYKTPELLHPSTLT